MSLQYVENRLYYIHQSNEVTMNHKKTIAKAKSMESTTDKESLFDCIILFDWWKKVGATEDMQLIYEVHKIIKNKILYCMQKWGDNIVFKAYNEQGIFPLKDATKQVGDIVVFGEMVGVVRKIEGKLFTVHMTNGQDLPFVTEED